MKTHAAPHPRSSEVACCVQRPTCEIPRAETPEVKILAQELTIQEAGVNLTYPEGDQQCLLPPLLQARLAHTGSRTVGKGTVQKHTLHLLLAQSPSLALSVSHELNSFAK